MKVVASRIIPRIEKLCLTQQGSHVLVSDCGHLKLKLQCFISIYLQIFCHFYINPYTYLGFPGGSVCKESACNVGDLGSIAGSRRFPWRRTWQPTLLFLPGESHGQRSLVGYSPWGHKESDMTEQVSTHTHTHPHIMVWFGMSYLLPSAYF